LLKTPYFGEFKNKSEMLSIYYFLCWKLAIVCWETATSVTFLTRNDAAVHFVHFGTAVVILFPSAWLYVPARLTSSCFFSRQMPHKSSSAITSSI